MGDDASGLEAVWVLLTNDDTLSLEDAATGYKGLQTIERCFRALKRTRIRMTPMHHWLPTRIEAHVKAGVLALLISRTAELAAGKPWDRTRSDLKRLRATGFAADHTISFSEMSSIATSHFSCKYLISNYLSGF